MFTNIAHLVWLIVAKMPKLSVFRSRSSTFFQRKYDIFNQIHCTETAIKVKLHADNLKRKIIHESINRVIIICFLALSTWAISNLHCFLMSKDKQRKLE